MSATNRAIREELLSLFTTGGQEKYPEETLADVWWVGLSLGKIKKDGSGVREPVGGGYKRVAVPRNENMWSPPTNGKVWNTGEITFPISTGHWGTIKEVFLATSPVIGRSNLDIWYHIELEEPVPILRGTSLTIAPAVIEVNRHSDQEIIV